MHKIYSLILSFAIILLSACTATKPGPVPQYSGFLPDYSILQQGKEGQAQRIYANPAADWKKYSKVLLDPVTLWRGQNSQLQGVSPADAQKLADYFYNLMYSKLSQHYHMVREPGPDTLRISVAIVKLEEGRVALETISTIVPQLSAATKLVSLVTGKEPLVGKASVEAKVTDAQAGTLLSAGVDERVGGKALDSLSLSSWGDVDHVMQFWVARASYHLCVKRGGSHCVAPKLSLQEKL